MKYLLSACLLFCLAIGICAQTKQQPIPEIENLLAKKMYKEAYHLSKNRFNQLLRNGNPDTLSFYVDYLASCTKKLKSAKAAEEELTLLLESVKNTFPFSKDLPDFYLTVAEYFSMEGNHTKAYNVLNEVLLYFKGQEHLINTKISSIHSALGTFALRFGNNTVSSFHYRKSLRHFNSTNKIELYVLYNSLGIVMWNASKIDSALYYMKKAVAVIDELDSLPVNRYYRKAIMQGNISNVYWEQAKVEESIKNAELSIANYKKYCVYAESETEKRKGWKGYFLSVFNLATSYMELGNFRPALSLLDYNYTEVLSVFGKESSEAYKVLLKMGTIYYHQREFKKALSCLKKSFDFWNRQEPGNWLAQNCAYIGYTYEDLGMNKEAAKFYNETERIYKKIQEDEYSLEYLTYLAQKAHFNVLNGKNAEAIKTGETGLQYAIHNQGEASLISIHQLNEMAGLYLNMKAYKQTLQYSKRALKAITDMLTNSKNMTDSVSVEIRKPSVLLNKAKAEYNLLPRKDSLSIIKILNDLADANEVLLHKRALLTDQADVNTLLESNRQLTDFIKELNYELFRLSGNKQYIDKIINVHEASLYSRIRSRIDQQKAIHFVRLPASVLKQEIKIKEQIQIAFKDSGTSGEKIAAYMQAIARWNTFQQMLKTNYPAYYQIRYGSTSMVLKNLSKLIPPGVTVIRYLFSEKALYALVVTNSNQTLIPLYTQNLSEKITTLNRAGTDAAQISDISFQLYNKLWQPIQKEITQKRVIIIPDGILYNLSFEMLTPVPTKSFSELSKKCLLNKYAISYHYSLLALQPSETPIQKMKNNFVAFVPGFSDKTRQEYQATIQTDSLHLDKSYLSLLPLPFTEKLVKKVRQKFGGDIYSESKSTADVFRERSGNNHIIHIGTHAEVNNEYPEYSRLIFAKNNLNPNADNSVYLYDIYNCNLTSDLAVITACESGKPGYQDGEGMISMAHAFSYAGSKSIMTGLWKLDEQATAIITEFFYTFLKEGFCKDEALQKAKLKYLQSANGRMVSPQYWAGLVIMGDTTSIHLKNKVQWMYYVVIAAFAGILFFYIKSSTSNKKNSKKW